MARYYSLEELQLKIPMVANELIRRKDIKPADVAPVVHAHWRLVSLNLWDCTNCHYVVDRWDRKTQYCPDCGAKMDEEINDA